MSIALRARDLLNYTTDQIWEIPHGPITLEMDDGVIETTGKETIFSFYLWSIVKLYPRTPLMKRHHINGKRLGNRTHAELLESSMFDCYEVYGGQIDMEDLCKLAYETVNHLYNDFTYKLEAYVSTISILDFIDVVEQSEIKEIKANVKPTQVSIDDAYRKITAVMKDENKLVGNAIAKAAKSGLVSMDQILQCVGIRGYIADIDSHIFRNPVLRGYVEGIVSLHDNMIESRSASKALMFTKDPLKAVEYFNRQIQMVCATFTQIHPGDCQSQKYLPFKVRSSDMESIVGKYYLTDEGFIQRVNSTDRHLIGKEVKFRSVFHCQHPDRHGCCSTCFGDLYLSMPKYTNQGHASSIILGEKASQNVMSTKHLDGSSKVDAIELSEFEQLYIQHDTDPNNLKLAARLKDKHIILRVSSKEAKGLSDLNYTKNTDSLTPYRISQLVELTMVINDAIPEEAVVPVSIGNRLSSFTPEMLYYIKNKGWSVNQDGDYEIDLIDWDKEAPLVTLPMKHLNMVDHMRSVEAFIKSPVKTSKKKNTGEDETIAGIFYQLYKIVSTKLRFNISHLEVIMFSTMITSYENKDFDIPMDADSGEFGYYSSTMKNRSMSALMAYQGHVAALLDPNSFIIKKRASHVFDPLLLG